MSADPTSSDLRGPDLDVLAARHAETAAFLRRQLPVGERVAKRYPKVAAEVTRDYEREAVEEDVTAKALRLLRLVEAGAKDRFTLPTTLADAAAAQAVCAALLKGSVNTEEGR